MNRHLPVLSIVVLLFSSISAYAFESGSTGADGAFNPTADTQLTLPPSGLFNFTTVNIPTGVTVTFAKNADNTPVYILASGDVTIDGTIDINGGKGGAEGDGSRGIGGPGGFDGGKGGGRSGNGSIAHQAEAGFGPGGGPSNSESGRFSSIYGATNLRTLIGGSGGAGALGNETTGAGGGGGAGGILIASSGTISINGSITAKGGSSGTRNTGYSAGNGSGGAIRLVATTVQGDGVILASSGNNQTGIFGGYIRIEAENMLRTANSSPSYNYAKPFPALYSDLPSLTISSIGGESVSASPTGFRDVVLSGTTSNPVSIGLVTSNIPLSTQIKLVVIPDHGAKSTFTSAGVSGSIAIGTDTVDVNLPNGNATLFAYTSYTIQLAQADQNKYTQYAQGEAVEAVRVDVDTEGQATTTFITVAGNKYSWPSNQITLN
jgi:hypothetical protein